MNDQEKIPSEVLASWASSLEPMNANEVVALHYHEQPEWLQILDGEMTFYSAGDQPHLLRKKGCLHIASGELHRVRVRPNGAHYKMWAPVPKT
jgi:quercetin dioxygenase-like cupin family protein